MISILGILLILLVSWLSSKNRGGISWYTVISGLLIQAFLAFFILKVPIGQTIFKFVSDIILEILNIAGKGGEFAFGNLYTGTNFIFIFRVTPVIIFISALVAVLYYLKIMHPILKVLSWGLQKAMKISGAESLANIASAFVGQVESALPLRPYFGQLSQAQFFSIMVGGMSTMSVALLATYSGLGIPIKYLLAANIMGIPSGLIIAKLMWPTSKEEDEQALPEPEIPESANVMDAAVHGGQEGLKISLGIAGMVIAFVSLIGLVDWLLAYVHLNLAKIFGFLFYPLSLIIGVPKEEASLIGSLLGEKIAINEFVAYSHFIEKMKICLISSKTLMLGTFVLCGFANFGSVAIQLGAFSQMLPTRRQEFAEMGLRSMIAGGLASCLSACWANLFF